MRYKETASLLLAIATSTLLAEQSPFDLQSNLQKIERDQQMILEALKSETPDEDEFGLEAVTSSTQTKQRTDQTLNNTSSQTTTIERTSQPSIPSTEIAQKEMTKSSTPPKKQSKAPEKGKTSTLRQDTTQKKEIKAAIDRLNGILDKKSTKPDHKKVQTPPRSKRSDSTKSDTTIKKALREAIRAVE